jgi:hypothetical protein
MVSLLKLAVSQTRRDDFYRGISTVGVLRRSLIQHSIDYSNGAVPLRGGAEAAIAIEALDSSEVRR